MINYWIKISTNTVVEFYTQCFRRRYKNKTLKTKDFDSFRTMLKNKKTNQGTKHKQFY